MLSKYFANETCQENCTWKLYLRGHLLAPLSTKIFTAFSQISCSRTRLYFFESPNLSIKYNYKYNYVSKSNRITSFEIKSINPQETLYNAHTIYQIKVNIYTWVTNSWYNIKKNIYLYIHWHHIRPVPRLIRFYFRRNRKRWISYHLVFSLLRRLVYAKNEPLREHPPRKIKQHII